MTVQFNIEYKAMFGEQIVVNIQTEEGELKLPLETTDGERWACDWCVESPEKSYTYYYSVEREGRAVKTEWLMIKLQLDVNARKAAVYTLYDHWKAMPEDAFLYSSAFTKENSVERIYVFMELYSTQVLSKKRNGQKSNH